MAEEKITDTHDAYAARLPDWQATADVLSGPRALKSTARRETYLPRLAGQFVGYSPAAKCHIDEYADYVARATPLTARAQRARVGMVGMVARKPATCVVPAGVEPLLRDVTLDGQSLDALAQALLEEELAYAWGAVAVSFDAALARPYLRRYGHACVTQWQLDTIGGRVLPRAVVLREQATEPGRFGGKLIEQYRLFEVAPADGLSPDEYPLGGYVVSTVWREVKGADGQTAWMPTGEPEPFLRLGAPIGEIPVIPAACQWTPRKASMQELVDLILSHYRTSADYENVLHFAGAGNVLFGSGIAADVEVRVGGSSSVMTPSPDAKLGWVTMDPAGATPLKEAMADKRNEMAVALARLLLSDEKRVAETEASQRIAFSGDDATLSNSVVAVERQIDECLAWLTWLSRGADTLAEARQVTACQLNREWIAGTLSAADLVQLGLEVDAGRMSSERQYFLAARGGLTEPGVDYATERKRIEAEAPAPLAPSLFGDADE